MASPARRLGRMCVLAAVVASVAGCMGMPANGPARSPPPRRSVRPGRELHRPVPFRAQAGRGPVPDRSGLPAGQRQLPNLHYRRELSGQLRQPGVEPGLGRAGLQRRPGRAWRGSGREGGPQRRPAGHGQRQRHAAGQLRRIRPVRLRPGPGPGAGFLHLQPAQGRRPVADHQPAGLPDADRVGLPAVLQGAGSVLLRPAGPDARP